jgi:hypothetical protein
MPDEAPTWEEATRCPRCGKPGKQEHTNNLGRRGKLHTIRCMTEGCKWYNTTWVVQTRDDGTIPVADVRPRNAESRLHMPSQDEIDRIERAARRQLDMETKPGTEVRR